MGIYFVIFWEPACAVMHFVLAKQAEELVLILMDKSSSASEYSQTWCVSVCTYTENTVYQNPSFLFLGLVFFASESIQASCLVCLFQSFTHM